jgi:hypothetical protein
MRLTYLEEEDTRREALEDLVCASPSIFGRLVAIATLREISPPGLAASYTPSEIKEIVNGLHRDIFTSWLNLSLKQQKADITIYLARIGVRPIALSALLARIQTLIPPDADEPQRQLFLEDMAIAYALFSPDWEREPAAQGGAADRAELPVPLTGAGGSDARAA